jgi:tetratricopeptide (TPR) repeat protein
VIAVLAARAFVQAWRWRTHYRWSVAVVISLVLAGALTAANRASGFDTLDLYRVQFENCTGLALTQAGRPEEAVEWYHKALTTNPAFTQARSSLVHTLQQLGRADDALAELRRAAALFPTDASLRNDLGVMLVRQGSGEEAVTQFSEAVRLRPESAEYQNNLGNALYARRRGDEAMEHYQAALRADPAFAMTYLNIGVLYAGTNRPDDALRYFGEAVRLNPCMGGAHYQSALVLLNRGRIGEGLAAMRRAHESAPDNIAVTSALAWLLATSAEPLRDPVAAAALARQANEQTRGQDPGVLDTLAAAFAASGQFAEAVRVAQNALDLAMRQNSPELIAGIRQRLELYEAGKAYTRAAASEPSPQGQP